MNEAGKSNARRTITPGPHELSPDVDVPQNMNVDHSTCIGKIINYLQLYTETPLQIYYNNYGETTKSYNIVILNPYNVSDQVTILS
jgi:hypothetical protein